MAMTIMTKFAMIAVIFPQLVVALVAPYSDRTWKIIKTGVKMTSKERELLGALVSSPPNTAVHGLISEIEATGKLEQLDEMALLGNWQLRYQLNSKDATNSQKALSKLPQFSNFITDESGKSVFRNIVALSRNRIRVVADVAYTLPKSDDPPGRLGSTICAAAIELNIGRRFHFKPLRIPLPLHGVGWLDVTYLSDSMRITRGNRGGLFVHVRPELCKQ